MSKVNKAFLAELQDATDFDEFKLEDIISVLKAADDAYENGDDPLFTDAQYDSIKRYVESVDPKNDYLHAIGSDVRGGKVSLPNAMGSLTQAYDTADFDRWIEKHGLKPSDVMVATEKEDGMSTSIHYNNKGEFRIAYSRGNGTEGADMSRHVKRLKKLPKKVTPNLEVRAELIISNPNFDKLKTKVFRRDGSQYKNPRNMVSGLMNASEIDPIAYDYIDIIVYHDWNESKESKLEQLHRFESLGFQIPAYTKFPASGLNDKTLTEILNKIRDKSEYLVDGIVVELDDAKLRNKMNPSKATLNPEYARKYKVADASNNAVATVDFVEWRVSKRGYLKPRVHFIPFPLCGVTVTHATGFNAAFIVENRICKGAKVRMTRSGDVIPFINGIVEPGSYNVQDFEEEWSDIGEWKWNDTKVDVVLTEDHANVGLKLAEAFFTAIGVDGLKLGNLQKMFDVGFDTPAKIIKASVDELSFALASSSTASKIHKSLHAALKNVTLPQFMGATGLFGRGIGQRKIQKLHDQYGDSILESSINRIECVEGFDTKSATKFINGLPVYKEFFNEVKDHVQFVTPLVVEDGKLNGQVFVFTGFRNKDLKAKLEAEGGIVVDSYSKKVTTVIAADPDERSTKIDKARKDGAKIIGLSDVDELIK